MTALVSVKSSELAPIQRTTNLPRLVALETAFNDAENALDRVLCSPPWAATPEAIEAAGRQMRNALTNLKAARSRGDELASEEEIIKWAGCLLAAPWANGRDDDPAAWLHPVTRVTLDEAPTYAAIWNVYAKLIKAQKFRPTVQEIYTALVGEAEAGSSWRERIADAETFAQRANAHASRYTAELRAALVERAALEICGCTLTTDGVFPDDVLQEARARVESWATRIRAATTKAELGEIADECAALRDAVHAAIYGPLGPLVHAATVPGSGGPKTIEPSLRVLSDGRASELAIGLECVATVLPRPPNPEAIDALRRPVREAREAVARWKAERTAQQLANTGTQ